MQQPQLQQGRQSLSLSGNSVFPDECNSKDKWINAWIKMGHSEISTQQWAVLGMRQDGYSMITFYV